MTPSAGEFDLSMNEVETTALKAARGTGLPWGVAEDVGRAARWLAATGADWSGSLIAALAAPGALDSRASPFLLGAATADRLGAAAGEIGAVGHVVRPVWLVAVLAASPAPPLTIRVGPLAVRLDGDEATATAPLAALMALAESETAIEAAGAALQHPIAARRTRSAVTAEDHAALEELVYRTYVPTSERSRLRGAGARR